MTRRQAAIGLGAGAIALAILVSVLAFLDIRDLAAGLARKDAVVPVHHGAAFAVPLVPALLAIAVLAFGGHQRRIFIVILACLALLIATPILSRAWIARLMPDRGYVRCPGASHSARFQTAIWARSPADCRRAR